MLYKIDGPNAVLWTGEKINGLGHPKNIEALWSDSELEAIGLYRARSPDPVPEGYTGIGMTVQVVDRKVKKVHSLLKTVVTPKQVKAEAQRRIYELAPQHVQANVTARGIELLYKGKDNLTPDEQAEADAGFALFEAVKGLRSASNALEQIDPIPLNYRDDKYWS